KGPFSLNSKCRKPIFSRTVCLPNGEVTLSVTVYKAGSDVDQSFGLFTLVFQTSVSPLLALITVWCFATTLPLGSVNRTSTVPSDTSSGLWSLVLILSSPSLPLASTEAWAKTLSTDNWGTYTRLRYRYIPP